MMVGVQATPTLKIALPGERDVLLANFHHESVLLLIVGDVVKKSERKTRRR
jgi:hypothetical protein